MKLIAIFLASVLALTACGGLTPSPVTPRIDPPPDALTRACDAPVVVTLASGERAWLSDRAALVACGNRHAALSDWAAQVTSQPAP
jgi:hypothetical protein